MECLLMDREEFFKIWKTDNAGWESIGAKLSGIASTLFRNTFKSIKGQNFFVDTDSDVDYCSKYLRIYQNILIDNLEDYTEESYQKLLKTLIIRRKLKDIDLEFK